MKSIEEVKALSVGETRWKDSCGRFYKPENMETRHLFFTLRMIWNHTVPDSMRFKPYKKYDFSPFYSTEYIMRMIPLLLHELRSRKDLKQIHKDFLELTSKVKEELPCLEMQK